MRRKDKEISVEPEIMAVIAKAKVCRLGMVDGNKPYIIPLSFGYNNYTLYFHGAQKGQKIDILRRNPSVCFEFDLFNQLIESEDACSWSMKYKSVIGFGRAVFIEDPEEKREALSIIMAQYSDRPFQFPDNMLKVTAVIKIDIESMTGKQSGF